MSSVSDKQLERYRIASSNCQHSKLVEKHDDMQTCYCAKMSLVIAENSGISSSEFSDQYTSYIREWHMKQPGFMEGLEKVYSQMKKARVI